MENDIIKLKKVIKELYKRVTFLEAKINCLEVYPKTNKEDADMQQEIISNLLQRLFEKFPSNLDVAIKELDI